ncbi:hypothetical protein [Nodosilinea sp. E11]|uniref:hypothetical protein n=1 Tax=Nodosilinea sp. E11 TaxID=3037479 RepID=UPI002934C178|nr:hypothetical protein [Nodosilinea sp. E11]WOD39727.1 hypothetical protein RRF56_02820 [Nodosilinea sp. E11]
MIREFELRLAEVLGGRLAAPFGGRVEVTPGSGGSANPRLLVGVRQAEPVEPEFGSVRPEIVPGSDDFRRILRLQCEVAIAIFAANNQGRSQQMQGLDAALYALNNPDFQDGTALRGGTDPGFLIQQLQWLEASTVPPGPGPGPAPVTLTLRATGWFWPVGVVGEAGREIGEIRVRGVALPLAIAPANPRLVAGGDPVDLALQVGFAQGLQLRASEPAAALPFDRLAMTLAGAGGRPGAGSLTGGSDGVAGVRLVTVAEGLATIRYAPPAEATRDELVVGLEDGAGQVGVELGRFPLVVRAT